MVKSLKSKAFITTANPYGNRLFLYCPDTDASRDMGIESIAVSHEIAKFQINKRSYSPLPKCSPKIDIKGNAHFTITNIRRNIHVRSFILLHKMESNTCPDKEIG